MRHLTLELVGDCRWRHLGGSECHGGVPRRWRRRAADLVSVASSRLRTLADSARCWSRPRLHRAAGWPDYPATSSAPSAMPATSASDAAVWWPRCHGGSRQVHSAPLGRSRQVAEDGRVDIPLVGLAPIVRDNWRAALAVQVTDDQLRSPTKAVVSLEKTNPWHRPPQ